MERSGIGKPDSSILWRILRRANNPMSLFHNSPVKIVIAGTDAIVHRFLIDYVALIREHEELFEDLDFRVYIVPVHNVFNTIATYISSVDYWY